jgi:hypothetical protein
MKVIDINIVLQKGRTRTPRRIAFILLWGVAMFTFIALWNIFRNDLTMYLVLFHALIFLPVYSSL